MAVVVWCAQDINRDVETGCASVRQLLDDSTWANFSSAA